MKKSLNWVKTNNYKNLKLENPLELKSLNVLIGPNGSGKSNLVAVLRFLKTSLTAVSDPTRGITNFQDAVEKLGNAHILDGSIQAPAAVDFDFAFPNEEYGGGNVLNLGLLIPSQQVTGVSINKEIFSNPKHPNSDPFYFYQFHNQTPGSGVFSRREPPDMKKISFEKLENVPANELMLFSIDKLLDSSKFAPEITPLYVARRQILNSVTQWHFYNANDMKLDEIRGMEPRIGSQDRFLSPDGKNLAAVLFNLSQLDWQFEDQLNQAMQSILPATQKVRATTVGATSLNVHWHWQQVDTPLYLNDLSDGTVRMLCWASILLSPQLPALLVIEEPEIGLHVAWMSTLANWIKRASRKTQVIISTHSPELLDQFTDQPENILVFHAVDEVHWAASPLSQERLQNWLDDGWELGDLYRVGEPVIGGWPW